MFSLFLTILWPDGVTVAYLNDHSDTLGVSSFVCEEVYRQNIKSFFIQFPTLL